MDNENIKLGLELRLTLQAFDKRVEKSFFSFNHPELKKMNMFILNFLFKNSNRDVFQKDIERHFNYRKSSVSDHLSVLENCGCIIRESNSSDGRYRKIVITDKGRELCKEFNLELQKIEEELRVKLSKEKISEIVLNLGKIRKCLLGD